MSRFLSTFTSKNKRALLPLVMSVSLFALAALGAGCAKSQSDEAVKQQLEKKALYGNVLADAFFDKDILAREKIQGRMVVTVSGESTSEPSTHLLLLDFKNQSMRLLTKNTTWVASPKFLPSGRKIVFCAGDPTYPRIAILDLETGTQRFVSPDDGQPRYDPEPLSDTEVIVNVFPKNGQFYLARLDLTTGAETTLTIHIGSDRTHNYAIRASEPTYDPSSRILYFVTDRAISGTIQPINIYALDLETGAATQVTHNKTLKISKLNGQTIASPQFYDLDLAGPDTLIFGLRAIEKHNDQEDPHFSGCEIHIANLKEKSDRQIFASDKPVRSPLKINDTYFAIFQLGENSLLFVSFENRADTFKVLSDIPLVGDADYRS